MDLDLWHFSKYKYFHHPYLILWQGAMTTVRAAMGGTSGPGLSGRVLWTHLTPRFLVFVRSGCEKWKWKFLFIHEKTFYWIQAKTTRWTRGSIESVAYVSNNGHGGGYTYRYRKIGSFSFHPSILLPANTIELFFFMPSVYNFHHNIRMSQGTPI